MRDVWYICKKECCEEPCVVYIEGGGHSGGDRDIPCLLSTNELRMESWRVLTQKDIDEKEIRIIPMDGRR